MRRIPVDTRNIRLVAAGGDPRPVYDYENGERQGEARDDAGRLIVRVGLMVIDETGANELAVKVPVTSNVEDLTFDALADVTVQDLTVTPYTSGNRVNLSATASAIAAAKGAKSSASASSTS